MSSVPRSAMRKSTARWFSSFSHVNVPSASWKPGISRCCFHVIVGRILSAADVVTKDVVAEAAHRIDDRVDHRVALRFGPATHVMGPPAQARTPALERLMLHHRVDDHEIGARLRGHDGARLARCAAAAPRSRTTARASAALPCPGARACSSTSARGDSARTRACRGSACACRSPAAATASTARASTFRRSARLGATARGEDQGHRECSSFHGSHAVKGAPPRDLSPYRSLLGPAVASAVERCLPGRGLALRRKIATDLHSERRKSSGTWPSHPSSERLFQRAALHIALGYAPRALLESHPREMHVDHTVTRSSGTNRRRRRAGLAPPEAHSFTSTFPFGPLSGHGRGRSRFARSSARAKCAA